MSDWRETTWGELATLRYGRALRGYQNRAKPYRVFGTNGAIGWHTESLFPAGVVVGRKGAYRGIHYSSGPCWVIDTAFYLDILNPQAVDTKWAYYQLRTVDLNLVDSGSAIPSTTRDGFSAIRLRLPPPGTQRRTVSILSALDDLIENNWRRVELLEQMAQAIYREWFIRFRYPGHAGASVESPLDPLPEGWTRTTLRDCASQFADGDWIETKDQGGGDFRLLQVSNISVGRFRETGKRRFVTQETFERLRCTEVKIGDLLISRMPDPIGRAWLVDHLPEPAITAVDVAILRPISSAMGRFLGQLLNSSEFLSHAESVATGTTRKRISRRLLEQYQLVCPPSALLKEYESIVAPLADEVTRLRLASDVVTEVRDLLLPKLVTGQIDLSDLDLDDVVESVP